MITIIERKLLAWLRVPAILVFIPVQPVMFVLLFRYVFGGRWSPWARRSVW